MSLKNSPSERLVCLNDPLLRDLIEACDDDARRMAMERLLVDIAAPTIRRALARFTRYEGGIQPADADDITSTVTLRLVRKLQACAEREEAAIERLPDYIATQTFNAIHDLLRARFPERMRLRNRIRYVLTHDPRLALWMSSEGPAAGLARFRDATPAADAAPLSHANATRAMFDRDRPADALFAVLSHINTAVTVDSLVSKIAELWNVTDLAAAASATLEISDERPDPHDQAVGRQSLGILWSEVRELRAPQRAALLLNLRDVEGAAGIAALLLARVATFDEVAEAVGLTSARLAEIWSDLPLDDLTIGEMLGLKRQQVINLRQAARDRLSRRMSRGRRR